MRILPHSEYRLHVQQASGELVALLSEYVETASPIAYFLARRPFAGSLTTNGFEIYRTRTSRSSFRPMTKASFTPAESGTLIDVHVIVSPIPLIGAVLVTGLVSVAALNISFRSLFQAIAGGFPLEGTLPSLAIPLRCLLLSTLAPLVTTMLYWLAFPHEDRIIRELLETAFGATSFLPQGR